MLKPLRRRRSLRIHRDRMARSKKMRQRFAYGQAAARRGMQAPSEDGRRYGAVSKADCIRWGGEWITEETKEGKTSYCKLPKSITHPDPPGGGSIEPMVPAGHGQYLRRYGGKTTKQECLNRGGKWITKETKSGTKSYCQWPPPIAGAPGQGGIEPMKKMPGIASRPGPKAPARKRARRPRSRRRSMRARR